MKKITQSFLIFTILFFATSFVNTANSQDCSHTFNMIDTYGDGWNGNAVTVNVNGNPVAVDQTIPSGSSGSFTFNASTGDQITLTWTTGSYTSEVEWNIVGGDGTTTVGSGGHGSPGPFAAVCPAAGSCVAPSSLSTTSTTSDSATVTWVDNTPGGADSFDIEYTDSTGTATTFTDVTSPYTITGLTSGTAYTFNVTSNCASGSETSSDASFETSAGCGDSTSILYDNNFDGLVYSFSAPSGQYASVAVGGETENNYDVMWITDGSGNDLYGSSAAPVTGALSGTYESTDGTILIYLTSDGSVNRTMTFAFSCYDPPSCIAPTALSAAATSSTEATVSWTAGDSETAWEYVVQTAGTGEPTGAGTATTTNPLSLSGLTAITAYEIYLRADCGGDLSPWVNTDFTTPCDTFTAPYSQDFENAGAIPDCWSMSGAEPWLFTNSAAASHIGNAGSIGNTTASGGYFAYVDDSSPDSTGTTLVSPLIDTSSLTTPVLSFYLLSNNEGNSNVSFSVDVYDGAAWNTGFYTSSSNTADWEEVIVNLSSLTITGPIQVRFVVDERPTGDFYDDVAIDDVKIMELPSCAKPTDLSVSNITSISASLTWNAGDSETAWEYVIQASGTGEPTGAGTATTTNPLSLSGLISNTDYEIYLRANCGGGELSEWVRTTFITTAGCGDSVSITYENSFNGLVYSFSAPTGQYASVTVGGQTESCCDDMWITDGSGNPLYGSQASPIAGSLSGTYESTDGTVLIYLTSDGSVNYEMTFAFSCYDPPSCIAPTGLSATATSPTEATVSWTAGDSETTWEYVVQAAGTGEPTGAGTATTTNPLSLSGLTGNTDYVIYLRADCGGDLSPWVSTDFITPPAPIVPDYINDFTAFPGDLWSAGSPNGSFGSAWTADGFANDGSTGAAKSNIYSSNNIQVLESPIFDLSGGVYYLNLKAAVTAWNNTNAIAMGSDDSVSVSVSVDGGNYDVLHTWNESNNPGPTGTNMPEVELDAYSSTNVKFVITMSDGTVDDTEDYDFFIDDFQITTTSSLGIQEVSALQFTYFPNPVNDQLTISAQTNIDNIVVLNMLGQVVSSQSPNSLNCLVDMAAMRTGVYFVQVSIGNNTQTVRVLKQ